VAIPPIPTRLELTSGEEVKYKRRFKNNGDKRWPETTRLVQVTPPPDDSDNSVFIGHSSLIISRIRNSESQPPGKLVSTP